MYDAVFVLVDAFNKLLRKKPDQFRSYSTKRGSQIFTNSSANGNSNVNGINSGINGNTNTNTNTQSQGNNRALDCNTSKGWVTPWEHGDKISRYLRKVS